MSGTNFLLGLIGSGIQRSLTPIMQMTEGEAQGFRCLYQLIDTERLNLGAEALPELLTAAERTGFAGLNITHPFKQLIIPHLTELSPDAEALGAVNTVVLRNGQRIGHNTDWQGFSSSFRRGLPGASTNRIVQLGAGGAGAATVYAMLKMGAAHVTVIDLDSSRSAALAHRMAAIFGQNRIATSSDVEASLKEADGLVHATAVGMAGHPGMALPASLLRPDLWIAEIVYFPIETELLRAARTAGCRTVDGSWMAVEQAVKAFELFTGLHADSERMHQTFVASLTA